MDNNDDTQHRLIFGTTKDGMNALKSIINGEEQSKFKKMRFPVRGINWEMAERSAQIDKDISPHQIRPSEINPFKSE